MMLRLKPGASFRSGGTLEKHRRKPYLSVWRNGRRVALRTLCRKAWRFKSSHGHHCFLVANKNEDAEPRGSKICPSGAAVAHLTFNQVAESSILSSDTKWECDLIGNYWDSTAVDTVGI